MTKNALKATHAWPSPYTYEYFCRLPQAQPDEFQSVIMTTVQQQNDTVPYHYEISRHPLNSCIMAYANLDYYQKYQRTLKANRN